LIIVYHQTKSISSILMKTKNKFECRRRRMVVRFTTTCTISVYRCEFEFRYWRGVLDTTLCDKGC